MDQDHSYFYQRAERELAMARQAACTEAQKAHALLAGHYLDRFYGAATPVRERPEAR